MIVGKKKVFMSSIKYYFNIKQIFKRKSLS